MVNATPVRMSVPIIPATQTVKQVSSSYPSFLWIPSFSQKPSVNLTLTILVKLFVAKDYSAIYRRDVLNISFLAGSPQTNEHNFTDSYHKPATTKTYYACHATATNPAQPHQSSPWHCPGPCSWHRKRGICISPSSVCHTGMILWEGVYKNNTVYN